MSACPEEIRAGSRIVDISKRLQKDADLVADLKRTVCVLERCRNHSFDEWNPGLRRKLRVVNIAQAQPGIVIQQLAKALADGPDQRILAKKEEREAQANIVFRGFVAQTIRNRIAKRCDLLLNPPPFRNPDEPVQDKGRV